MISRIQRALLTALLLLGCLHLALGDTFPTLSGEVIDGEPVGFGKDGVAFRKPDGSLTSKVHWTNFTQEAVTKLASNPMAKQFAEEYLETDIAEPEKRSAQEIKLLPVERLDRPNQNAGLGSLFRSPLSLLLLLVCWGANIYAGYEIARYRYRPLGLVCGVSAVLPVIGPIIFLAMPPQGAPAQEPTPVHTEHAPAPPAPRPYSPPAAFPPHSHAQTPAAAAPHTEHVEEVPTETAPVPAGPAIPEPVVYRRGQTTFNRRFFETKLAGFLRVVPSEAERDMVIYVNSSRGEHLASRIARIQPNELVLLVMKAGASMEVPIPYTEISEVIVRHKDAP